MNAGLKLGAYGVLLAAILGGGAALGAAAGPIAVGGSAAHDTHERTEEDNAMSTDLPAGGLLVSQDGYDVALERDPTGGSNEVTVTVRRDGKVVTTEPYLGAAGHLVALRDGDLAYLHVHPLDQEPAGPVRFAVEVPSAGTYVLFFDFQVDGQVRTASFVIDARDPVHHAGSHTGATH